MLHTTARNGGALGAGDDSTANLPDDLGGVRSGDRDAIADFVLKHEPLIRRRVRGKLGQRMRRVFDSSDVLSTVLRRLDLYASRHEIRATNDEQLMALIMRVANAAVIDKIRIVERLKRVEGEDGEFAQLLRMRLDRSVSTHSELADLDLELIFDRLKGDLDRQILWLWLSGREPRLIAMALGCSSDVIRKRWQRIREGLHSYLLAEKRA